MISDILATSANAYLDWLSLLGGSTEVPAFIRQDSEPTAAELRLAAGIRAGVETMYHGDDFMAHVGRPDREMVERAVRAAWEVWEKGADCAED